MYAALDWRRPGVAVDGDALVALGHASGVRSRLWMSKVAALRTGAAAPVDPQEAIAALYVLEAARSAAEGGWVRQLAAAAR